MNLHKLRTDFTRAAFSETDAPATPHQLFETWLGQAIESHEPEPNAMCLSTVSPGGKPSSRIVLLKDFNNKGFAFFTNYQSRKGRELSVNSFAALLFYWSGLERQVRIEGNVEMCSKKESDTYFAQRPQLSRLGAWASPQSEVIPDREFLDSKMDEITKKHTGSVIPRPSFWGGYRLNPTYFEFWQGRPNRLHDRITYTLINEKWEIRRLAP